MVQNSITYCERILKRPGQSVLSWAIQVAGLSHCQWKLECKMEDVDPLKQHKARSEKGRDSAGKVEKVWMRERLGG